VNDEMAAMDDMSDCDAARQPAEVNR